MRIPLPAAQGQRGGAEPHLHRHLRPAGRADPEVADKDVTVHRIFRTKDDVPESMKGSAYVRTLRDEIVSLLSYAVGCMFGRYSLDAEGLAYAGGEWDASRYKTFLPDADNCIPVTDEEYFPDDVVGRLVEFVRVVYGAGGKSGLYRRSPRQ